MAKLILYNDDHNSSLKVIASLIRYCEHNPHQADQCTLITHNVGQCEIKNGDFMELLDIKNKLETLNITVELTQ
jgi:ATP-dependent Clp protease adaptor protein ClpS